MWDSLLRDLRAAARLLAARPGWTAAAILCLAIATGANTAAFTLVNGLLLRPLPFDQSSELVVVALREPRQTNTRPFSLREYRDLAARSGATCTLLARTFFPLSLSADGGAQMAEVELVSANYFDTLRVKPFAGRFFDASADRAGDALRGVLSYALWRRRFGADPAVIGRSMRVNGRPMVVAGIAPPGFVGAMQLVAADLWLPAAAYPDLARSADADTIPMFGVMGRLATDVKAEEAQAHLTSAVAGLPRSSDAPGAPAVVVKAATGFGVPVAAKGAVLTLSEFIYVMMALLMAVACANVAALVLARSVGRTREIAVRLSLGASRTHIARQLLTESLALAFAGCAAGTFVALWLTQSLVARMATPFQYVSYAIDVHPDARVFACSAFATALATVLCGVAPVRHAARVDVLDLLRRSGANGRSRQSRRTLNAMVTVQFAVSTMLLAGAGMLVRSYVTAESVRPGFETSGLLAAAIDVSQIGLDRPAGMRLYQDVIDRMSALPGVTRVSLTRERPFAPGQSVTVLGHTDPGALSGEPIVASAMTVSAHYFETLGVAVRRGRAFDEADPAGTPVALINDAMARRLWPGASPLGRAFSVTGHAETVEVIGTVPDLVERSLDQDSQPVFYRPFAQTYSAHMTVLTRVHGNPGALVGEIRRTMHDVNPDLSIVDLRTVDQLLDALVAQQRVPAAVLSLVGLLGLLLSAVGLYGVVAYGVRERVRELGIRLALGARPADVQRLVFRQGFIMVGIGLGAGIVGATGATRVLRRTLFGAGPLDPLTLAAVCTVLLATGCAALYLPARWASRLEPAQTLRSD